LYVILNNGSRRIPSPI